MGQHVSRAASGALSFTALRLLGCCECVGVKQQGQGRCRSEKGWVHLNKGRYEVLDVSASPFSLNIYNKQCDGNSEPETVFLLLSRCLDNLGGSSFMQEKKGHVRHGKKLKS